MSDILDPIPSPDGTPEEQSPQDLPIDVNEPASLPIDVIDEAPVKKSAKPAAPAAASAPPSIPTPAEPAKSDSDKKKKTWIIVAVVVLLLICCCCILPWIGSAALPADFFDEILREIESGVMLPLFAM
jgi:hypothetical protein